jgi:hypothetical protein
MSAWHKARKRSLPRSERTSWHDVRCAVLHREPAKLGLPLAQERADEALDGLTQGRVRDVTLVLVTPMDMGLATTS